MLIDNCLTCMGKQYPDTDKFHHGYLPHYQAKFLHLQWQPMVLLEIGVMKGASLRMWRDFFTLGRIYGIDADPSTMFEEERIKTFLGRQEDTDFLRGVRCETGPFDIVVDDGSHHSRDHLVTFETLWPHLKNGGWYCIEDGFSLYNDCWTLPGERTILDLLREKWEAILTGASDIVEVHITGRQPNDGMVMIKKRDKPLGT